MSRAPIPRHYGLDWLRVAAFAILIVYHVGMVFVPWGFHAKSAHGAEWAVLPMLAVNAWRLSLLFVVSGYASRALLTRAPGIGGFLRQRTMRLLVPLAFGVAVVVPPQSWVELVTQHGYAGGFATFWVRDDFRFGTLGGIALPALNHLWFVLYLWLYTAVLALLVAAVRWRRAQAAFDAVFDGPALLLVPAAWLVCIHAWWFPMGYETHDPAHDLMAHLSYLPAFLFGFALAGSARVLAACVRWRWIGAAMGVAGYAFILAVELAPDGGTPRWLYPAYGAAHAVQQWGTIVALVGLAERHWNRDARLRPMLTEAVFPFYLVHQTIIVLVAYWLTPAGLPGGAEFAVLVAATVAGCWLFYLAGRRIAPLRPLIGLRALPHPHKAIA
ncbi:acyltransferase family protein [Sphingomonas sp. A2-49]|uniref:acyltransferase family protein n=1 Tax=Sphingomonas sp. A2-49 TaxID=1391375 RepID=UPI0021CFFAD7|nr:acyltransferase family protein [Sphingomonas sp. A2-49]MCU6456070.1 acyltransferase family protein [Sphingomonas sp. A2-49]